MEIEQITRENGQKEWFIDLNKDEAFDLAMRLLGTYRREGTVSFHNMFEWFNFTVSPNEK